MSRLHNQAKVVFLIDVSLHDIELISSCAVEKRAHAISLSSFRLLNYFSTYFNNDHLVGDTSRKNRKTSIQWGYKFFNSKLHSSKIEPHSLKDLKLRYFEEYENEVGRRFQKQFEDFASVDYHQRNKTAKVCSYKRKTQSLYLGDVLKDIMYDFQWESDMDSPVQRKKSGRRSTEVKENDGTFRCIFLFAHCPKSEYELREFAGKKVLDEEILTDSIMSPDVLSKFRDVFRLSLYWIDTWSIDIAKDLRSKVNLDSISIVQKTLQKVTGNLIPLDATVQLGNRFLSNSEFSTSPDSSGQNDAVESNKSNESSSEELRNLIIPRQKTQSKWSDFSNILPFTSVLDYYISHQPQCVADCQSSSFQGILMKGDKEVSRLQLVPSLREKNVFKLKDSTVEAVVNIPIDNATELNIRTSTSNSSLCHIFSSGPINFHAYGLLQDSYAFGGYSDSSKTYLCTGYTQNKSCERSVVFEKLIYYLAANKKIMVLQLGSYPYLALMKPSTTASATLTVLPVGLSLQVEKYLYKQNLPCLPPTQPPTNTDDAELQSNLTSSLNSLMKMSVCQKFSDVKEKPRVTKTTCAFDARSLDRWHLPGSKSRLTSLINKLNDKISQLDFLSDEETRMLRNLQKVYRQDSQPPRPRNSTQPTAPTPGTSILEKKAQEIEIEKKKSFEGEEIEEGDDPESIATGGRKAGSVKSRGAMMVSKSRQVVKEKVKPDKESGEKIAKKDAIKPEMSEIQSDFHDEHDLVKYLGNVYDKSIDDDARLITCVQTIVMVTHHFMKNRHPENSEKLSRDLIESKLIKSSGELREKYQSKTEDAEKQKKIREYQLQILLRLEMESALQNLLNRDENGECDEEIVTMLRTLSFITEPSFLSKFMNGCFVYNYVHSIPKVLGSIFDELMQPLPDALLTVLSPNHSADESVFNESLLSTDDMQISVSSRLRSKGPSSQQPDSVGSASSQPPAEDSDVLLNRSQNNRRSRRLVQHPSLLDVGAKRQIVIDKKIEKKSKDKPNKMKQSGTKSKKKERETESRFESTKTKLERRQSVAVMERTKKTPNKFPKKMLFKSPTLRGSKSPCSKIVAETPRHKQFSQIFRKQQERERRKTMGVLPIVDCNVVEESPVKQDDNLLKRKSPTQSKRALAVVRRMFYSVGPGTRSRNLTKYFKFADRIGGRNRYVPDADNVALSQSYVDTPSAFESPNKVAFLKSQLLCSPTPAKHTPKKSPATPKGIPDSPCMNTRSKSPGSTLASPRVPFRHRLFSSGESFSNTDNDGTLFKTPQKTPLRSKEHRSGSLVMDSPCHNTRSQGTVTPTRESVCTALFLKSPGKLACQNSPVRSPQSESPVRKIKPTRTHFSSKNIISSADSSCHETGLVPVDGVTSVNKANDPRGSLMKDLDQGHHSDVSFSKDLINVAWYDPHIRVSSLAAKNKMILPSPVKITSILSPKCNRNQVLRSPALLKTPPRKRPVKCLPGLTIEQMSPSAVDKQHLAKVVTVERTPSPQKKVIKTPDSFDKWHRRKRKYDSDTTTASYQSADLQKDKKNLSDIERLTIQTSGHEMTESIGKIHKNNTIIKKDMQSNCSSFGSACPPSVSRKRNRNHLLEHVDIGSPGKKRLTSEHLLSQTNCVKSTDCVFSSAELENGSQKSDSISLSQRSGYSDYFSPMNDEVFISSQDSGHGDRICNTSVNVPQHFNRHSLGDAVCLKPLCCSKSDNSSRSNSPVFGSCESTRKSLQKKVIFRCINFSESDPDQLNTEITSPSKMFSPVSKHRSAVISSTHSKLHKPVLRSPSGLSYGPDNTQVSPSVKKYSPVVTAKSLMHLMNSPLLQSNSVSDLVDDKSPSPRIDKDSIRLRQQRTKGHSRRSLNLHS